MYPAHPMFLSSQPPFANPDSDCSSSDYESNAVVACKTRKRPARTADPPSMQPFYPQYMCASKLYSAWFFLWKCILTIFFSPMHMPLSAGMLEDASQSLLFQDDSVRLNHILPVPSPQFDPMSMLNADMFTGSAFAPIPAVELSQNESGISRLAPFACSNSNIGYSIVEASRCIRSVQLRCKKRVKCNHLLWRPF